MSTSIQGADRYARPHLAFFLGHLPMEFANLVLHVHKDSLLEYVHVRPLARSLPKGHTYAYRATTHSTSLGRALHEHTIKGHRLVPNQPDLVMYPLHVLFNALQIIALLVVRRDGVPTMFSHQCSQMLTAPTNLLTDLSA